MNDDIDLTDRMRQLASAFPRAADSNLERRLMAAFRARHSRKKPIWIFIAAAVLACVALLAGFKALRRHPMSPGQVGDNPGFIALPYAQSGVPMESAVIMRLQMRRSELVSMGLAMPAAPSNASFKADLLVGQDGVPRAVRFVK